MQVKQTRADLLSTTLHRLLRKIRYTRTTKHGGGRKLGTPCTGTNVDRSPYYTPCARIFGTGVLQKFSQDFQYVYSTTVVTGISVHRLHTAVLTGILVHMHHTQQR